MRRFKHILAGLFLVILIAIGCGLYLGWIEVFTHRDEENKQYVVSVAINEHKLSGDTEAAKRRAQEIGNPLTGIKSARGSLGKIDEAQHFFTLTEEDHVEMIFVVPSATSVGLKELHSGEQVNVEYKVEDGHNVAQSVTTIRKF